MWLLRHSSLNACKLYATVFPILSGSLFCLFQQPGEKGIDIVLILCMRKQRGFATVLSSQ